MKELIKTLLTTPTERLKNPFIGTFIFALMALNWRPILYMSSSKSTILERITYIDKNFISIYNQLWLPLLLAIFYIVALPYLTLLFERLTRKAVIDRKENQLSLKLSDLKSNQKTAEQESILENIKANYRDKADLNKQIEELNKKLKNNNITIKELESTIEGLNHEMETFSSMPGPVSNDQPQFDDTLSYTEEFEKFKKSDLYPFFGEIGTAISRKKTFPKNTTDIVKEKFKYSGLLEEIYDDESKDNYNYFTVKGKHFWKEYLNGIKITESQEAEDDDLPF